MQSYAFYNRSEEEKKKKENHRVLVLCRNLDETKKVDVKVISAEEYEHELWWASQLDKDKWHRFQPSNDYKKFEKVLTCSSFECNVITLAHEPILVKNEDKKRCSGTITRRGLANPFRLARL